jgi:hypothetical protein
MRKVIAMSSEADPGREAPAATLRRLDRLTAELARVKRQRDDLAIALSAHTGRAWEQELEAVGVDLQTPRDPRPSPSIDE